MKKVILISTDKAVRSTNIMGASKRISELVVQSLAARQSATVFSMVRFGNVIGSSGSVIPLFAEQIRRGGPVTVTHPEVNRYFMTIPEAASLVIQAGAMSKGGEVFVLDMGEPVKILDLAQKMIELSGLRVKDDEDLDGDIEIKFSGLRPGEKLYEELLIGKDVTGTEHPLIMQADEAFMEVDKLQILLDDLNEALISNDIHEIHRVITSAPTGYAPPSLLPRPKEPSPARPGSQGNVIEIKPDL